MFALAPLSLVLLIVITVGTSAAILAWRERPEPGAGPLAAMLVGQVWWSVFLVFELEAETLAAKAMWYDVQWIGVVVIPVAWLVFALEYTGRDAYVTPRNVALLSVVPATTVALALGGDPGELIVAELYPVETTVGTFMAADPGPAYYVIAGYTYLLGLLGSVPLVLLVRADSLPFRGQGVALLVGTLVPWASNVLYLTGALPWPGLDPTPVAFAVSGVAYLAALTRFRLLTISPSPRRSGRRLVFEHLHDPAFVVDNQGYVVDCNESAATTFGRDRREALGRHASEAVPHYDELEAADGVTHAVTVEGTDGRRPYDVTVRRVTDAHDRPVGRVVVFHDVGQYLRQQQRLEVLNRVLRHNVRTETNLIYGYADLIAEDDEHEHAARIVKESAMRIHEMSERTRAVSELFEDDETLAAVPLGDALRRATDRVRLQCPSGSVTVDDDLPRVAAPRVLEVIVENLLTNAIRHNPDPEPSAWVSARADDEWIHVRVADDGPGIDEEEYAVLERGTETPLEHGSGIGLWLVKWGTDLAGGEVTFESRDPTGSVVTVTVPVMSPETAADADDGDADDGDADDDDAED